MVNDAELMPIFKRVDIHVEKPEDEENVQITGEIRLSVQNRMKKEEWEALVDDAGSEDILLEEFRKPLVENLYSFALDQFGVTSNDREKLAVLANVSIDAVYQMLGDKFLSAVKNHG